jgi:hypothetical protein
MHINMPRDQHIYIHICINIHVCIYIYIYTPFYVKRGFYQHTHMYIHITTFVTLKHTSICVHIDILHTDVKHTRTHLPFKGNRG